MAHCGTCSCCKLLISCFRLPSNYVRSKVLLAPKSKGSQQSVRCSSFSSSKTSHTGVLSPPSLRPNIPPNAEKQTRIRFGDLYLSLHCSIGRVAAGKARQRKNDLIILQSSTTSSACVLIGRAFTNFTQAK